MALSMYSFIDTRPTAIQRRKAAHKRAIRRKRDFVQKYTDDAAAHSEIEIAENDAEILAHKIEHQKVQYGPEPDFDILWEAVETGWGSKAMEYNSRFHTLDDPLGPSKAAFAKVSDLLGSETTKNPSSSRNALLDLSIEVRAVVVATLEANYISDLRDAFREDAEDVSSLEYAIENDLMFKHPWHVPTDDDGPSYFEDLWTNCATIDGEKREILEIIREELSMLGVGKFTIRYARMHLTPHDESPTCLNFSFWDQKRRVVRCVWHGSDSWSGPFRVEDTADAGRQTWSKFKISNGERVTDAEDDADGVTRHWAPCNGNCRIEEDPLRIKQIALDIARSSLM